MGGNTIRCIIYILALRHLVACKVNLMKLQDVAIHTCIYSKIFVQKHMHNVIIVYTFILREVSPEMAPRILDLVLEEILFVQKQNLHKHTRVKTLAIFIAMQFTKLNGDCT